MTPTARLLLSTALAGSLLVGGALAGGSAVAAPLTTGAAVTASGVPAVTTAVAAPAAIDAAVAQAVVASWYQQFLGRSAADDGGSRYWVALLQADPADRVLARLLATPEHVQRQVAGYYTSYLGRTVDGGASYWTGGVTRGAFPLEWVAQNVLASGEFAATTSSGGGGAADTVSAWYATILGRLAGPGEAAYWAGRLRTGSSLQVVREIWYSAEAVNLRVADHYETYLGRSGGASELAYWFPREVSSDDAVIVAFASSAEYLSDPPASDG